MSEKSAPVLYVLQGLPASGKTTQARRMVTEYQVKRVNKDDLRAMVDNGIYSPSNEEIIRLMRDTLVQMLLEFGFDVVSDDTNLKTSDIEAMRCRAEAAGARLAVVSLMDVPIEECIRRDAARPHSVGAGTIERLYQTYLASKENTECQAKIS